MLVGVCMLITEAKSCQLIGTFPSYFPVFLLNHAPTWHPTNHDLFCFGRNRRAVVLAMAPIVGPDALVGAAGLGDHLLVCIGSSLFANSLGAASTLGK